MADTASDVPGKFDVVINGHGYMLADSIEPSLPFRTHRAIYDITPTFVERQNVSNQYGDQAQDFFLTESQKDWTSGRYRRFFRQADNPSAFWDGTALDLSKGGQVRPGPDVVTVTTAAAIKAAWGGRVGSVFEHNYASNTNLYFVNSAGSVTDAGAHGAGTVCQWGVCGDGVNIYIAGATKLRKWTGAAFSDFSATTNAGSLAFLNNTLYACDGSVLRSFDGTGTATTLFTWKDATNTALTPLSGPQFPKIVSFGGDLLIYFPFLVEGPELWLYDGVGPARVAVLPDSMIGYDITVLDGIVFLSGEIIAGPSDPVTNLGGSYGVIYTYANGSIEELWRSPNVTTTSNTGTINECMMPALGSFGGKLIFSSNQELVEWNPGTGAFNKLSTLPAPATAPNFPSQISSTAHSILQTWSTTSATAGTLYPASTYPTSATFISSLYDFDSSLTKVLRGVTIDWVGGGQVDIYYSIDDLEGSYSLLRGAAASGTEYAFPANTTGHSVSIKLVLSKSGSSVPTIKRVYVRASPELQQFVSGTYILDCTGTATAPRELRDGSYHPLTGYEQVQNLLAAAKSTTPFSITDKVNGTFTGVIDLQDNEGWDVYEVHPSEDDPTHPGSFLVRVKVRQV